MGSAEQRGHRHRADAAKTGALQPGANGGITRPKTVHLITEVSRRVYADRAEFLGDPDFYDVPRGELLTPAIQSRPDAVV